MLLFAQVSARADLGRLSERVAQTGSALLFFLLLLHDETYTLVFKTDLFLRSIVAVAAAVFLVLLEPRVFNMDPPHCLIIEAPTIFPPPSDRGFSLNPAPKNTDRLNDLYNTIFFRRPGCGGRGSFLRPVYIKSPESRTKWAGRREAIRPSLGAGMWGLYLWAE